MQPAVQHSPSAPREVRPSPSEALRRLAGLLLVILVLGLVAYPFYYLSLPPAWQSIADLPQDLSLLALAAGGLVPLLVGVAYACERRWRWRMSTTGVTLIRHGRMVRQISWDEVVSLDYRGRALCLRLRGGSAPLKLRFVRRADGTAALAARPPAQPGEARQGCS